MTDLLTLAIEQLNGSLRPATLTFLRVAAALENQGVVSARVDGRGLQG